MPTVRQSGLCDVSLGGLSGADFPRPEQRRFGHNGGDVALALRFYSKRERRNKGSKKAIFSSKCAETVFTVAGLATVDVAAEPGIRIPMAKNGAFRCPTPPEVYPRAGVTGSSP